MLTGFSRINENAQFRANYREMLKRIDAQTVLDHYGARNVFEKPGRDGTIEYVHSCLIDTITPHHTNGDESPSASMSSKLAYHCWSYGGGDVLWFIQEMEDCERDEALHILAGFVEDTDEPRKSALEYIKEIYKHGKSEEAPIPNYSDIILEPWYIVHPYLTDIRGFNEQTLQRYGVGYDNTYHQIVLPHWWEGNLVGYQKRRIDEGPWPKTPLYDLKGKLIPKYKNSVDFPKDKTLFNYDTVQGRHEDSVIIVESVMSVLRAESWVDEGHRSWGNVLCTFGGKVLEKQLEILTQYEEVTVWMDNDPAGWAGTIKLYNALKGFCTVKIIDGPKDLDLGDLDREAAEEVRTSQKSGSLVINQFRNRIKELKK